MDVVSFFAGCGGLDLGFEQAGFNVVWANEFDPHCRATYVRNHPNTHFVLEDICKINPNTIPNCDGFIGGPPCQSWSAGGKQKGIDDKRGQLFLRYIEIIDAKKPKFFLIENVKGMLDEKFKDVFEDFVNRLDQAGYNVQWKLLNAVNFNIPQNRERVFFIGFRKDLNASFTFPVPTCKNHTTLEQAIGDITEVPRFASRGKATYLTANQHLPNHDVLTSKFGPFYYRGNRRRGWNQPSFTINATAEFAPLHPSSPKMIFYGRENWNFQKELMSNYRRLSVRECARIQTFPDSFIFEYEDISHGYKMIGNAVPPRLGQILGNSVLLALDNKKNAQKAEVITLEDYSKLRTLVGYYKNESHRNLIIQNLLYYVRSDGRKGSMFKNDSSIIPKYLLLHHKDKAELYELYEDEPILADASFLRTLGFSITGETYLCFRLKSSSQIRISDIKVKQSKLKYNQRNYSPYLTTIDQIIDY